MRSKTIFLSLLLSIASGHAREAVLGPAILPQISAAAPAGAVYDAYRSGKVYSAQEQARLLADEGDPEAMFLLAYAAETSETRAPSRTQAMIYLYRAAAERGNAEAVLRSALTLWDVGTNDEKTKAKEQIETAVGKDDARACRIYGEAWQRGLVDGRPNIAKTLEWWKKAAALGDADTFVPLGGLLYQDPQRDEAAATAWLEKAVDQGNADALLVLGDDAAKAGSDSGATMGFYHRGAEAGQTTCMLRIATHLLAGGKSDEGISWMKRSADAGNARAAYEFGMHLKKEKPEDLRTAYHYLLSAAKDGLWQAQYQVAMIERDGALGESDPVAASAWLTQAISAGDAETQYQLAVMNEAGIGGPINYSNSGILYNLANMKGHPGAPERLAHMAYEGIRLARSNTQAWAYARLALDRGNEHAKAFFEEIDHKLSDVERAEAQKALEALIEANNKALKTFNSQN